MPSFNIQTAWTINEQEIELKVEGIITPERAPPVCSNHDSPAFSDPGDPGEVEVETIFAKIGKTWWKWGSMQVEMMMEDQKFYDHIYEKAEEYLFDAEADRGDYLYEQAKDNELTNHSQ